MIELCERDACTGCMSCKQKCAHHAISIVTVNHFDYPEVDRSKCVDCGLCTLVCPIINKNNIKGFIHHQGENCLAAWNKDTRVRMESSSGGVFSAFANHILASGGIVFGAAWNNELTLVHKGICHPSELDGLRRSKYVQSDVGNTYKEVQNHLKQGKNVLFCGTPCQIAGLKFFLGNKEYDTLFCIDVICQGVPSPYLFKKYIDEVEADTGMKVEDCNFRSKEYGWRCGLLLLLKGIKNSKAYQKKMILEENSFYNAFIRAYFMRPSCYDCKFKNQDSGYYSDITIADFWRIGNKIPLEVANYEKGISAIVINTDKGRSFIDECLPGLENIERTWIEFATNGGLRRSIKPSNNDAALLYLNDHTWKETQHKYFPVTWRNRIKVILSLKLKERNIRRLLKIAGRL